MTKRVTVSLPDDIAEMLERLPARQVSPFVAEALRRRKLGDDMRQILRSAGHREFAFDPEGARARLAAGQVPAEVAEVVSAQLRADGLMP